MKQSYKALILILTLLITSCAAPLTKNDLNSIKTIGLLNSFPDNPNYLSIGITIFENETSNLSAVNFKDYLTTISRNYLEKQGYKVVIVETIDAVDYDGIDMVINIIPRDALHKPGTYGYGFYQRTMFGSSVGNAQSYVALNLSPKSKYFSSAFSAYYKESFNDLHLKSLPEKWDTINTDEKEKMKENLKSNINTTVLSLFKELGV